MPRGTRGGVNTFLKCDCKFSSNIKQIKIILPNVTPSIIEISKPAFKLVTSQHNFKYALDGAILESAFEEASFDFVLTMGVLVLQFEQLVEHIDKMFNYLKKFILIE